MRVLHINDVANVGTAIVDEAQSQNLPWLLYDIAKVKDSPNQLARIIRKAQKAPSWLWGLWRLSNGADLLHIHGGTVYRHTAWLKKPYVLHLHGTDIRTTRYQPEYKDIVEAAVTNAEAVFYTTPDLREHVLDLAPNAKLLPVTVDVESVPFQLRRPETPRVLFSSRWEEIKGGQQQLDAAEAILRLRSEFPDLEVEGLDWGPDADKARNLGVHLVPKMPHEQYLRWLSSASVIVGQMSGIMSASELEGLACGVPVVTPLNDRWYTGTDPSLVSPPVLVGITPQGTASAQQIAEGVKVGLATKEPAMALRDWTAENHGPGRAVRVLSRTYDEVLANLP